MLDGAPPSRVTDMLAQLRITGQELCRFWRNLRACMDGSKLGRDGPPLVRAIDDRGGWAGFEDAGEAEQEGGDPCGALHP